MDGMGRTYVDGTVFFNPKTLLVYLCYLVCIGFGFYSGGGAREVPSEGVENMRDKTQSQ